MAVDSKTDLSPGQNRNSVRITSNKVWNKGLLIIDAVKMPFGCGVVSRLGRPFLRDDSSGTCDCDLVGDV